LRDRICSLRSRPFSSTETLSVARSVVVPAGGRSKKKGVDQEIEKKKEGSQERIDQRLGILRRRGLAKCNQTLFEKKKSVSSDFPDHAAAYQGTSDERARGRLFIGTRRGGPFNADKNAKATMEKYKWMRGRFASCQVPTRVRQGSN